MQRSLQFMILVFSVCVTPMVAQQAGQQTEIEMLKSRVADLERQIRTILESLAEQNKRAEAPTESPSQALPLSVRQEATSAGVGSASAVDKPATLKPYGLLRFDVEVDSQRPNNGQIPFFINPPDSGRTVGSFSMHPRLTRFGVDINGPRLSNLADAEITGKLELDFENGGSESRQIIRIRHAYFQTRWNSVSILAGQTWDIVSPLFPTVNNDSLMWNAGNPGDRRPQFRVSWEPKTGQGTWSFVGGAGLMGAVDLSDLDNNGFRDGEESVRPNLQGRVGFSRSLSDQKISVGGSFFYGRLNTSKPVAGRTAFSSQLMNVDYTLPLTHRFSLRGEGWWGRNLADVRGGAGQGINLVTGREIRARGGWTELTWKVCRYWSVHPGWTIDKPVTSDVAPGGRTRNGAFYIGNRITPTASFIIGADYLKWKTDYQGSQQGVDNRVNIFFQYLF